MASALGDGVEQHREVVEVSYGLLVNSCQALQSEHEVCTVEKF